MLAGAGDLLVRHPEHVAENDHEALVRRETSERGGELAALVREQRRPRGIALLARGLVLERERLRLADPLTREAIAARVHDQAMEPGRELRLAAELAQARAQLDERLLRGVPRILEVAHELRREPVHAWGMPSRRVRRAPVRHRSRALLTRSTSLSFRYARIRPEGDPCSV